MKIRVLTFEFLCRLIRICPWEVPPVEAVLEVEATQPSCKNALLKAKSISILAIIKWPSKKAPVEAPVD